MACCDTLLYRLRKVIPSRSESESQLSSSQQEDKGSSFGDDAINILTGWRIISFSFAFKGQHDWRQDDEAVRAESPATRFVYTPTSLSWAPLRLLQNGENFLSMTSPVKPIQLRCCMVRILLQTPATFQQHVHAEMTTQSSLS